MEIPKIFKMTYKGIALLALLPLVSGILFHVWTGDSLGDSFYWALITLTTVGYGDVKPPGPETKILAIILACFGIMLYGYIGALIMFVVMDTSLSGVFGMSKCKYKNHFVICGWNSLSDVVLSELLTESRQIAVITEEQDDVIIIKRMGEPKNIFPIYGDPSKNDVLEQANIADASVVILSTDDDSKNLITALHIRELSPNARIIVRTNRAELKKTMKIAGVTYVVTPDVMAGRLIASAAFEPEVANFIEDVTSATDVGGFDIRQYPVSEKYSGSVSQLSRRIKEKTKTTLVGVAKKKKVGGITGMKWDVLPNPDDSMKVNAGDMVILLGNDEQFKSVADLLGTNQGR
jgi:voltage-gated potassium channel